jgi:acetoin utilization deacetylase AcuC-like enzyme
MRIFRGRSANRDEICEFHHPNYIEYLQNWVSPQPQNIVKQFYPIKPKQSESEAFNEMYKINRTFDCPSFDGLYNFCELAVGGSLDAADLIITGESHHAINWSGGYHHAKKS